MLSGASNWYARTANTADGPVRREMTGMQELRVKESEMTTHLRSTGTALAAPALIAIICVGLAGCSGAVPRSGQSPDGQARAAGHPESDHPDLMVLTAENSTLSPGAQFTLSATVKNVGGGAAAATMLSYYRSDDATITTDDTPVGTAEIAALAADQSARESTELTAPTTFGTYYYGACVDAVTGETEQANNCSASVRITVTDSESDHPESDHPESDHPDLMVLTAENSTLPPGAQFTLSATVKNVGGGAAAATMLSYYRSDDATITTDDTPVGTAEIAALAADQSARESTELTAPTTFGTYYYGACVDAVTGETEQANNCSASVRITVTDSESDHPESDHPDLMVLTAENSTLPPGAQFTLSATVKNVGGGAAAATMLSYYRSDDATITTDDTPVGTAEIAALAADQSARESTELTAPTTFGTYYYGACVDAVTGETEQANNCSASVRITVTDSESDTPGAGLGPAPTPDESTRPLPMIRVADERATEGVDPEFVFRVTLDEASSELVTVRYATEDISALAGSDYYETSGTLTFAAGEVNKAVKVKIIDDSVEDSEETMKLVLSDPTGVQLADAGGDRHDLEHGTAGRLRIQHPYDRHRLGRKLADGRARVAR